MGSQLKEALRCLCVEIGWSYAVFWRAIRFPDKICLAWEDGHCERVPGVSGFEAMDLLLKERAAAPRNSRGGVFAEPGCQADDRVGALVYKMMESQVHVVGDGIVGQAALMGNHRWILRDAHGSIPKGLAEMNHQFFAGIQTIAIIPVLPHGVVQLGSTQMVMENIEFINHVRSLFAQLCCVPGALVSDTTQKPMNQNIHLHALLGIPTSLYQSGNSGTYISRMSSPTGDKCHKQLFKAPGSRSVSQPFPTNSSEISSTTATSTMTPLCDFSHPTIYPVVKPIIHQHSQLESGSAGAQEISSNPVMRSTENAMLCDSISGSQHQSQILTSGVSSSGLVLLQEQLLSISGSQEPANKHGPKISNSGTYQLKSHGDTISSSPKDSDTLVLPLGRSGSPDNVSDLGRCSSFPVGTRGSFWSQCAVSSGMEVPHMLDTVDYSNSSQMLLRDSQPRHPTSIQKSPTVGTEGQRKQDDNSFQALDVTSTKFEEHISRYGSLLDNKDGWLSRSDPVEESKRITCAATVENDACTPLSGQKIRDDSYFESLQVLNMESSFSPVRSTLGNDLFDLLGLNNKSGSFHGSLDDVVVHCDDANAHELSTGVSTCITLDMEHVYDAVNEEISCSGLFSEASPDQLLDAVVAQINSGAKQNLDDNVLCKTPLTKISSSSRHTISATCARVGSPEQIHGACLGLSPMLAKSEAAGSSSVISACSMDKSGSCSQKDGGYKSQISLWVENGQKINHDSISAAHGKMIDEVGKLSRKRPRPGENPRPRPKDRQMIQDRVKELREIVPNGAKCSIDALLEKTIKHMLFLQSVTKHADKLKEVGEPKIMSKEGGLLLKDNFEGGATWAFEVGTRSMICPIIVEDLNVPRQMLVEMLCEERGLFLEIADLIKGLGLTILKGVMEARNEKVWARFAVEANRDITRMEIFLSLVRLLEPNAGSSILPQGVESLNMPHNMFHPSSIPATGLSDRLR